MSTLTGKRVLVIEDSPVIAEFAVQILQDLGCVVSGPAPNIATARQLAEEDLLDAAIVDVRIRGAKAYGICQILDARGIPFLLTSGYADWEMPLEWADRLTLAKPYTREDVEVGLAGLFS